MEGVTVIQNNLYSDERGYLINIPQNPESKRVVITESNPGTLRGLHMQKGMRRTVRVLCGRIHDFTVNVHTGETYDTKLDIHGPILSLDAHIAHGFYALCNSVVMYEMYSEYDKSDEISLNILDPFYGFAEIIHGYSEKIHIPILRSKRDNQSLGYMDFYNANSVLKMF